MKLISMTEFTLNLFKNLDDVSYRKDLADYVNKTHKYARFINQPLTLGMFVPCDEDGNLLEEPQQISIGEKIGKNLYEPIYDKKEVKIYEKAKDKVLFEGFGIEKEKFSNLFYDVVRNYDTYVFFNDNGNFKKVNDYNTIEDLVLYKLPLTQNAIKQFNP